MTTSILRDFQNSSKLNSPSKGITKTFLSAYESIEIIITRLVRMIVNVFTFSITEIAPMVAPLPPAFSIFTAMSERLHAPFFVSIIASIAIEVVGMFSSKVSIRCYQWNTSKTKSEQSVPQGLSILMTSVFFVVVLLLALTVELAPSLTALVIPGFVLIAISVYVNLAIHTSLEKLETDKANTLELREAKNGLNAQIREAQKLLQKLTQQATNLTEQAKIAKQELTQLGQELTIKRQEKTNLETVLNELKVTVNNGQNGEVDYAISPLNGASLTIANEAKKSKVAQRRETILTLLDSQDLTQKELAETLGVSTSTIKSDLRALNGTVQK